VGEDGEMRCFRYFIGVAGILGFIGCESAGPQRPEPLAGGQESGASTRPTAVLPSADDIRNCAPAFAAAVTEWRAKQTAADRVLILGPTLVGLEDATAQMAAEIGTLFGDAVNAQLDSRTRFAQTLAGAPDEIADADTVFDARLDWEPARKSGSKERRLVLELVDPRDGRTVYTTSQSVTPSPVPVTAVADASRSSTTLPAGPVAVAVPEAKSVEPPPRRTEKKATPPATRSPGAKASQGRPVRPKPAAPPAVAKGGDDNTGAASAVPVPGPTTPVADRGAGAEDAFTAWSVPGTTASVRSWSPSSERGQRDRLPVLRRGRGTVYFANAGLADRVIVVREDAQTLDKGELRLRLILAAKKGNKALSMRCEFYDKAGAPAGSVIDVQLRIREGRSSAVNMVSRNAATRYVLFIDED
jgi:hypothetical protein